MRNVSIRIALVLAAMSITAAAGAMAQRDQLPDEILARDVVARLMSHDVTGVSVSVESGIVTLRGTVPTLWTKERAREQALKVDDVITVVNEVTVPRGESDEVLAGLVAKRLQRYVFFSIFEMRVSRSMMVSSR